MVRVCQVLMLGLLFIFSAPFDFAQESATKGESVLRVETRLIEVNVVAQDAKGHAVKDLTRADFKLFDDGKEIPIDVFAAEFAEPAPPTATVAVPPPNTFTNRIHGVRPSVTVILLDGLNTNFENQTWARKEVARFLENLQPQDRVAVFFLGDRLSVLQDFTSDPKALLSGLKSTKARIPMELAASVPSTGSTEFADDLETPPALINSNPGCYGPPKEQDRTVQQAKQRMYKYYVRMRVERTVDALNVIAGHLRQFPGRKNLIWVSASFPISIGFDEILSPGNTSEQIQFTRELERAFKALNNADMAIYPVDARGLVPMDPCTTYLVNNFYSTQSSMGVLAEHTGGQMFLNTNDLARATRSAVDDAQANYTLGFYPHDLKWDGAYHELTVKVAQPGVHLRYRQGYFAAIDNPEDEEQSKALIHRALHSPLDTTGVALTVALEKKVKQPIKQAMLHIAVDAHNIAFEDTNGGKLLALEVVLAQSAADGRVLKASRGDIHIPIAASAVALLMNDGLRLERSVDLEEGATTLELVVRDLASGNIGSVRIPLGS
jgi:VWFA-related protein